ncbi:cysteine hydrolase family protein [Pseudomonas syringae]|uniref:cysteine hydrolase family protein n=1 Tax=Pseudomonas syringae TaxID=317 RepID=UPI003F76C5DE
MSLRTAVLALHYQNEVLHPEGRIREGVAEHDPMRDRVIEAAGQLLSDARKKKLPILHVRIAFRPDYADCPRNTPIFRNTVKLEAMKDGEWGAQFIESLSPFPSEREYVLTHTRISAFKGTALEQTLRMLGVQRLVVAGVATHSVVENTVREAADLGYEISVAADACSAAAPKVHQAALSSMALIADITTVAAALLED